MRLALAFGRPDVDRFLDEIDHEQFEEWSAFLALEPTGWQAHRLMIQRLSYMTAQVHTKKRLAERKFDMTLGANIHSPEADRARMEAYSIRQNIASRRRRRPNEKRNG